MAVVRLRPADLLEALRNDGTSLQFQVQVHVPTGTLAGVEALVRWPHFQYGMIGPQEIAQLVMQGGLHEEFDFWVIRAASKQAADWIGEGVPGTQMPAWKTQLSEDERWKVVRYIQQLAAAP